MYCQLDTENIQCDQSVVTELGGSFAEGKRRTLPVRYAKSARRKVSFGCKPTGKSESSWKQCSRAPLPDNIIDVCNVVNELILGFPRASRSNTLSYLSFSHRTLHFRLLPALVLYPLNYRCCLCSSIRLARSSWPEGPKTPPRTAIE